MITASPAAPPRTLHGVRACEAVLLSQPEAMRDSYPQLRSPAPIALLRHSTGRESATTEPRLSMLALHSCSYNRLFD
jgi:hypothetical protein